MKDEIEKKRARLKQESALHDWQYDRIKESLDEVERKANEILNKNSDLIRTGSAVDAKLAEIQAKLALQKQKLSADTGIYPSPGSTGKKS